MEVVACCNEEKILKVNSALNLTLPLLHVAPDPMDGMHCLGCNSVVPLNLWTPEQQRKKSPHMDWSYTVHFEREVGFEGFPCFENFWSIVLFMLVFLREMMFEAKGSKVG